MRVHKAQGRGFFGKGSEQAGEDGVLKDIGEVAGVKEVAVSEHGGS
jgi:hypothetical protein